MLSRSVIFVLFVGLFSTASAHAKLDVSCSLDLAPSVGVMVEANHDSLGGDLLDENGAVVKGPYSRMHYRTAGLDNERVKVAIIRADEYYPGIEQELENRGFIGVAIRNPDERTVRDRTDFIYAPEWVRTVMKLPADEKAWLDGLKSDVRNQIVRKLKKSKDLRVEVADATWAEYEEWRVKLYEPYVVSRNGGIPVWVEASKRAGQLRIPLDLNRPLSEQKMVGFKRIFVYSEKGELIGGSILAGDGDDPILLVRGAAWSPEAQKYEASFRAFSKAINLANAMGMRYISYGEDTALQGVDSSLGLLRFKASLGMGVVPSSRYFSQQLIKYFPKALQKLRDEGKPFQGIAMYGVPPNDPQRIYKYNLVRQAMDKNLGYERREDITGRAWSVIQIGEDADSDPIRAPHNTPVQKLSDAQKLEVNYHDF